MNIQKDSSVRISNDILSTSAINYIIDNEIPYVPFFVKLDDVLLRNTWSIDKPEKSSHPMVLAKFKNNVVIRGNNHSLVYNKNRDIRQCSFKSISGSLDIGYICGLDIKLRSSIQSNPQKTLKDIYDKWDEFKNKFKEDVQNIKINMYDPSNGIVDEHLQKRTNKLNRNKIIEIIAELATSCKMLEQDLEKFTKHLYSENLLSINNFQIIVYINEINTNKLKIIKIQELIFILVEYVYESGVYKTYEEFASFISIYKNRKSMVVEINNDVLRMYETINMIDKLLLNKTPDNAQYSFLFKLGKIVANSKLWTVLNFGNNVVTSKDLNENRCSLYNKVNKLYSEYKQENTKENDIKDVVIDEHINNLCSIIIPYLYSRCLADFSLGTHTQKSRKSNKSLKSNRSYGGKNKLGNKFKFSKKKDRL